MKKQKKHLKTYTSNSNIEELITYSGLPQHKHLPYATKQMIAREVELEKMRMAETTVKTSNTQKDRFVIYRLCWCDIVVFAARDNFIFRAFFLVIWLPHGQLPSIIEGRFRSSNGNHWINLFSARRSPWAT